MWDQMTFGEAVMWSNPYMLIFWLLVLAGVVALGIAIVRTLPHHRSEHDDTQTLSHH